IRQWFKKVKKEENLCKGKEAFEKELKKQGVLYSEISKGEVYERLIKRNNIHSMEDLYAAIGVGILSASTFIAKLKDENIVDKEKSSQEEIIKNIDEQISKNDKKTDTNNYGITVKGLNNLMVRFARCCNPVPGDDIEGYITKGRGISVHRQDCSNLKDLIAYDSEKVVEVSWGSKKGEGYVAEIQVKAEDRMGILSDIMLIITESKLNLNALDAKSSKGSIAIVNIKIKIDTVEQLKEIMKKIRKLKGVMDVYRMNN
ncbi:MAG: ACT domain-containing protein, partial [Clostridium sp.]